MLNSALALLAPLLLAAQAPDPGPTMRVTVDSARKEVVVTAGPFTIAHMPPNMDHGMMHEMAGTTTPLLRFEWPMEAWFRGFDIEVTDANGTALGSTLVHHLNIMNFNRRQLLYPAVERMVAAGSETGSVSLPKTIGMPMEPGYQLAMYAAWNNLGDADIEGAWLTVRLAWSPKNLAPRPRTILPIYMDVNYNRVTDSYDLPAGRSSKSYEFTMPLTGRVLAIGGHVHDYAEFVSLEEVESGKTDHHAEGGDRPVGPPAQDAAEVLRDSGGRAQADGWEEVPRASRLQQHHREDDPQRRHGAARRCVRTGRPGGVAGCSTRTIRTSRQISRCWRRSGSRQTMEGMDHEHMNH